MNKNKGESKDSPFAFLYVIANQRAHWCGNLHNTVCDVGFEGIKEPLRQAGDEQQSTGPLLWMGSSPNPSE